jgi:integrase
MRDFPTGRGGIRSESTVLHNNERVRSFVDDFGPRKLSDVSRLEARAWILGGRVPDQIAEIAAGWQGAERRDGGVFVPDHKGNRSVVRSMYSDAANDGLVRENPFAGMRLEQSKGRAGITVLTEKELQQLEEVAVEEHGPEFGPRYAAMIKFAAWSGMRPAEIYALRWGKIDFQGNRIRVDSQYSSKTGKYGLPKSQKPRTIALTPGAREALMALPRRRGRRSDFQDEGRPAVHGEVAPSVLGSGPPRVHVEAAREPPSAAAAGEGPGGPAGLLRAPALLRDVPVRDVEVAGARGGGAAGASGQREARDGDVWASFGVRGVGFDRRGVRGGGGAQGGGGMTVTVAVTGG